MHTGGASFYSSLPQPHQSTPGRHSGLSVLQRIKLRLLREIRSHRRYLGHIFRPNIWRVEPVSRDFGFDRGLPVDRFYTEQFLAQESVAIHGAVLEIGHDLYTRKFGGSQVTSCDVLYREAGQPGATIIADLADAPDVASDSFDC